MLVFVFVNQAFCGKFRARACHSRIATCDGLRESTHLQLGLYTLSEVNIRYSLRSFSLNRTLGVCLGELEQVRHAHGLAGLHWGLAVDVALLQSQLGHTLQQRCDLQLAKN